MATSFLGVPRAHVTAPWSRPLPFGATRELGNHHRIQRPDQPNIGPVYNSLQWDRREIRLIHIKPASNLDEPLECQLVAVSLDDNPRYGALSYTWGDARDTVTIKVHGYPMKITKNLAEALVEFRSRQGIWCLDDGKPQKPLHYLWADAICIDQEDVVERNHQVGIMYQIYSRAAVVISWLHSPWKGPSFRWGDGVLTDIILTFQMLKRLESQVSTHTMYWIDAKHDRDVLLGWTKEDVSLDGRVITPGESPALWKALATFFGHPYFTRLWIIQEVAAARRHIFLDSRQCKRKGNSTQAVLGMGNRSLGPRRSP
ncbi:heterokaryon incompatibility protein-domain-containing protein [Pyrenochaeta sp. MPI-SDFR-AT-0127]|nr:heterokaryon incompatibility protein-domain-containing protein [Pyrenochaeta sp. MPI-SDFR-AT-0127]